MKKKILGLNVPTNDTIKSRTSTVAKSLATSIIPRKDPTEDEINEVKNIFITTDGKLCCAYCSDEATEWDHFHALVVDSKPTGYITEINNLVPCCKNCNPSKGNKEWEDWLMNNESPKSPKGRKKSVKVIQKNRERLIEFDKRRKTIIKYDNVKGFKEYWDNYSEICKLLEKAQEQANELMNEIQGAKNSTRRGRSYSINNSGNYKMHEVIGKFIDHQLSAGMNFANIKAVIDGVVSKVVSDISTGVKMGSHGKNSHVYTTNNGSTIYITSELMGSKPNHNFVKLKDYINNHYPNFNIEEI